MKSRDPNTFNQEVQGQNSSLAKMWRHKMAYKLPSHLDDGYRYGSANLHDHNMNALITNSFERENVQVQRPKLTKMRKLKVGVR